MAHITAQNELAASFAVEFEHKLYFRVEILRVETGQAIQSTTYFAEVYQLRAPLGATAFPQNRGDTRFRQSLLFLDDFPLVADSSVESVRTQVLQKLSAYADAYLKDYDTAIQRSQPGR
jgi:hypothetical protein